VPKRKIIVKIATRADGYRKSMASAYAIEQVLRNLWAEDLLLAFAIFVPSAVFGCGLKTVLAMTWVGVCTTKAD